MAKALLYQSTYCLIAALHKQSFPLPRVPGNSPRWGVGTASPLLEPQAADCGRATKTAPPTLEPGLCGRAVNPRIIVTFFYWQSLNFLLTTLFFFSLACFYCSTNTLYILVPPLQGSPTQSDCIPDHMLPSPRQPCFIFPPSSPPPSTAPNFCLSSPLPALQLHWGPKELQCLQWARKPWHSSLQGAARILSLSVWT